MLKIFATVALPLTVILSAAIFLPPVVIGQEDTFAGAYRLEGKTLDGTDYTARVSFEAHDGFYTGTLERDDRKYSGVAIADGDNIFFAWGSWVRGPRSVGIVTYTIVPGGVLDGRWVAVDSEALGTERGLSAGTDGLIGEYKIQGRDQGRTGRSYEGTLSVTEHSQGYKLEWKLPDLSYSGLGLQESNQLVGGWAVTGSSGISHWRREGEMLRGSSYSSDAGDTEQEQLYRVVDPEKP